MKSSYHHLRPEVAGPLIGPQIPHHNAHPNDRPSKIWNNPEIGGKITSTPANKSQI